MADGCSSTPKHVYAAMNWPGLALVRIRRRGHSGGSGRMGERWIAVGSNHRTCAADRCSTASSSFRDSFGARASVLGAKLLHGRHAAVVANVRANAERNA